MVVRTEVGEFERRVVDLHYVGPDLDRCIGVSLENPILPIGGKAEEAVVDWVLDSGASGQATTINRRCEVCPPAGTEVSEIRVRFDGKAVKTIASPGLGTMIRVPWGWGKPVTLEDAPGVRWVSD